MKILTANRLIDGEAVWFSTAHRWSETIEGSEIATDKAAEEYLTGIARTATENNEVVDAVLIDVQLADGEIRPLRLREQIRAAGPSNRTDLGKQARPAVSQAA